MKEFNFIVIGAGMSGAAAAYYLSDAGRVLVLERENTAGYHSTGRSAALFSDIHGPDLIRKLAKASYGFLSSPPDGFTEFPLLSERGLLFTGLADGDDPSDLLSEDGVKALSVGEAQSLIPFVKAEYLECAYYYADAHDIDVASLHQGFLKGVKSKGSSILTGQDLLSIQKQGEVWHVETQSATYSCLKLINAAGAWADDCAELAGVKSIGLVPKRRTVITTDLPQAYQDKLYPMVIFNDSQLYFKSEHGQVLISPMDQTPSAPVDAAPEDYDVALAAHLFEERTGISVKKINNKWSGLRSFVDSGLPVAFEDPAAGGFIWLAGQGGYGIKIAAAMGRIVKSIALGQDFPADLTAIGLGASDFLYCGDIIK